MSRILAALRFLLGLAFVAAGAALSGPTIVSLVTVVARHQQHGPLPAPVASAGVAEVVPTTGPQGTGSVPPASTAPAVAWPEADEDGPVGAVVPNPHYQPPPPPAPLPPVPAEWAGQAPGVAAAYRATLDVPPPPLLDAHAPPPLAVGWTAHELAPATAAEMPAAVVPESYVIRDGDDLTGIATRFYGHASAATAVWAANRDALPDPQVLPIGAVIRLPPAWTMQAARPGDPRAIEPRREAAAATAAPVGTTVARPAGWLAGATAPAAAAAPPRPTAVRVAPGETLSSLARRFYGDDRMAGRIWEANRDRLRSPELVVAGMELRLP